MSSVAVSAEGIDLPTWNDRCKIFTKKVLEAVSDRPHEVSIVFCSNRFIKELNRTYRGKDEPTDVLSFPQYEGEHNESDNHVAGDVVISLDAAAENSREFEVELEEEIKRLIVHGVLHLLGWDHADNSPQQEMLRLQEQILLNLMGERLL